MLGARVILLIAVVLLLAAPGARADGTALSAALWTSHPPLLIEGDANFTAANGVVGGSGTPSDPYIISGWDLDANASAGIRIRNTTASFVIRDTFVHGALVLWDGIRLENVTHASVYNVAANVDEHAIAVIDSADVNVSASTLSGWDALWFLRTNDSSAVDNTIGGFGSAVLVVDSSRLLVLRNHLSTVARGIWSDTSDHLTIAGNIISGATWNSITLQSSRFITVRGNQMIGAGPQGPGGIEFNYPTMHGVRADPYADSHTITPDNTILGRPVLYYADCENTSVDAVAAGQLIFASCDGVTVSHETLEGRSGMVTFANTWNWTLIRNTFQSGSIMHIGGSPNERVVIVLNNFLGAGFEGSGMDAQMNLPYPLGGNYWTAYDGTDQCSGPRQDVCPDTDGFGDTAMVPGFFGTDHFPRMHTIELYNTPPTAAAAADPSSGVPSTRFSFNASSSTDDQDPAAALQVRWDWDNDGVWDTNWTSVKIVTHSFPSPGTYSINLEVRDSEGWLSMATVQVTVAPTPLAEILADNWAAAVLVAAIVMAVIVMLWRRGRRRPAPIHDVPPVEKLVP